jgi:hypothetical protein
MARQRTSARDCELLASATGATPERTRLRSSVRTEPPPTASGAARNESLLDITTSASSAPAAASAPEDEDAEEGLLAAPATTAVRRNGRDARCTVGGPLPALPLTAAAKAAVVEAAAARPTVSLLLAAAAVPLPATLHVLARGLDCPMPGDVVPTRAAPALPG